MLQFYAAKEHPMDKLFDWLIHPPVNGPRSILFLRLMAGGVFFWEGLLKFVYTNQGIGRFTKLGIPYPHFTANFVGGLEIVGGLLLLSGLATRLIAIPFVIEMIVAILTTKISLYLGTSPLPLPPSPPKFGIWAVMHEIRSDYAQILTTAFLLVNGPGKWSLDALLLRKLKQPDRAEIAAAKHASISNSRLPSSAAD
jgi:putative oxidoreductase